MSISHLKMEPNRPVQKPEAGSKDIAIVQADDVWKVYHRGQEQVAALRSITFNLLTGQFAFIVGPSGCGKSTLLHLVGAIDSPSQGVLKVSGVELNDVNESKLSAFRRKHIGFVFQFYNLLPALNALENVALPLLARGIDRRTALDKGRAMLADVGLAHRSQHKPAELSGGEQQRVAVARAVIGKPSLVLADEPTGDLDSDTGSSVIDLMFDLNRRFDITFLIATHNQAWSQRGDRVLSLENGRLESS